MQQAVAHLVWPAEQPKFVPETLNAVTLHLTPALLPHSFQDKRGFISEPCSRGGCMTPGAAEQASKQPGCAQDWSSAGCGCAPGEPP